MSQALPPHKKRVRDVEDVLQWAYKHELPKRRGDGKNAEPCAVSPMFRLCDLGVRVDNWSREPGFPINLGDPHQDALKVEEAVKQLARLRTHVADLDGLELAPDFAALGVDEAAPMARAFAMVEHLVAHHAKAGDRPFWTRRPDFEKVRGENGKPVVLRWETQFSPYDDTGYDALVPVASRDRNDYPPGCYCPLRFNPDPQAIVTDRAEYLVWWTALDMVARSLSDLDTLIVLPPSAAQKPWLGEPELGKPPRIFDDLSSRAKQEGRETAAAHRMLGLRRIVAPRRGAPVVPIARRRHAAVADFMKGALASGSGS